MQESIVKDKDLEIMDQIMTKTGAHQHQQHAQRPHLYNRNDAILLNDDPSQQQPSQPGYTNRSDENWTTISDTVDYNEKIQFCDDDEDDDHVSNQPQSISPPQHQSQFGLTSDDRIIEESKRKTCDEVRPGFKHLSAFQPVN